MLSMFLTTHVNAQGCVAIRNISGFGQYHFEDKTFSEHKWQINFNNRYFKSYKDYREGVDIKTPSQNRSINRSYSLDISLSRYFSRGWSAAVSLPVLVNGREASFEHGGANTPRHTTHAFGIGDIRFTVYKWLTEPRPKQKINLQLGLGIKLPTGDYDVQDYFYRSDTAKVLAAVNPAIQPGDGGTGIITELNSFYILNRTMNLYANAYYLFSPREQNGVSTTFGRQPSPAALQANNTVASVTDVYSFRAGFNVDVSSFTISGGLRYEGVPVYDAIGGSEGTRRAGYNISAEPGLLYRLKKATLYTYIPIIFSRKLKQNVPDKKLSEIMGSKIISPGGFADYIIFVGAAIKL